MAWKGRVEVRGPDLRLWRVGRRWSLWQPHLRKVRIRLDDGDAWNLGSLFDDFSAGIAVAVVVFIVVLLTSPLAGVSVFFAEWMLALLLIPIAVAYRIVFRRPWLVYAESADGRDSLVTPVIGWRESQDVIERAVTEIRSNGCPQSDAWHTYSPGP